jgi:carbonic anhydrase
VTGGAVTPADALARLVAGNEQFQKTNLAEIKALEERGRMVFGGQAPHSTILSCSDSRVDPNAIFLKGLGELFVVRVAGNYPDDLVLASIEFAVAYLGSRLVMVLGHEKCGAVKAVYDALATAKPLPVHLATFERLMSPGLKQPVEDGVDENEAVRANVRAAVASLRSSPPVLQSAVASGHIRVVGAQYHLANGAVTLVD